MCGSAAKAAASYAACSCALVASAESSSNVAPSTRAQRPSTYENGDPHYCFAFEESGFGTCIARGEASTAHITRGAGTCSLQPVFSHRRHQMFIQTIGPTCSVSC